MSILEIELTPEMERGLREQAKRRGLETKAFVQAVMLQASQEESQKPKRSIMELEGLGADLWRDEYGNLLDAQEYVNELRHEWDHRP